jgi:predicted TIM-barrel fold metal-dependent hydrolase
MVPKLITLEEHFISKGISGAVDQYNTWSYPVSSKLSSIGDERLKDMDSGGVNLQVISHAPYCATIDECRIGNDELAMGCKENTKRFAAFAMLSMLEPGKASVELERCVKQLGFVGALIVSKLMGKSVLVSNNS